MRSCRRFLAGIPHLTVDNPRGTHPSATPSVLRQRTFDLHVLGTPPAFILSQDQTRHPMFFYINLSTETYVLVRWLAYCCYPMKVTSKSLTGCILYFNCLLTTLQLFRYLIVLSHLAPLSFPFGASGIISLLAQPVNRFFRQFSKIPKIRAIIRIER